MRFIQKLLFGLFASRRYEHPDYSRIDKPVSSRLADNEKTLKDEFHNASDFVTRRLTAGGRDIMLAYIRGIIDATFASDSIIKPLQSLEVIPKSLQQLEWTEIPAAEVLLSEDLHMLTTWLLQGKVIILVDGHGTGLAIDAAKFSTRSIEEPSAERTIVGPREGFIESIAENIALLRRRLATTHFKSTPMYLGTTSRTAVAICYLEGKVSEGLLQEVTHRLENLAKSDLNAVLDATYIQEAIEDHPQSPFPQIIATERPDRVIGNLLEGRVAVVVDGTPYVLIAPAALPDFFQTPEDYYLRPGAAAVARLLRYIGAFIATTSSALYVAILTYHYELIPARLIINVGQFRALTPFSPFFEAMILEGAVELLREATNRLPAQVGQVLGVVGALVLGQAAIQASLVGPLLVIVVAVSTIASFAIPNNTHATALRLLRFPIIVAAGFL